MRGFAASSPVTKRLTALATAGAGEQKLASCRRRAVGYGLVLPALVTYLKVSDKMLVFFLPFAVMEKWWLLPKAGVEINDGFDFVIYLDLTFYK